MGPIVMMVAVFAIFYFLMIMPQQRKQKKWAEMLTQIKPGDRVVTSGGLAEAHLEVGDIVGGVQAAAAGIEDVVRQRPLDTARRAWHERDRGDPEDRDEQRCGDTDAQPGRKALACARI